LLEILKLKKIRFGLIVFLLFATGFNLWLGYDGIGLVSSSFAAKKSYKKVKSQKIPSKKDFTFPVILKEDKFIEDNDQSSIGRLRKEIERVVNAGALSNALYGIKIKSLRTGEVIYEKNSNLSLLPASNVKLITAAASLAYLKPEYTFKTMVYYSGAIKDRKLHGNIYLKGFGDPSLTSEDLWVIANDLFLKGIREVTGDLIADDSFFDSKRMGDGWEEYPKESLYTSLVGALSLNYNTVRIVVSPSANGARPIAMVDPPTDYIDIDNRMSSRIGGGKTSLSARRTNDNSYENEKIILQGRVSSHSGVETYKKIENPHIYTATVFKDFLNKNGILLKGKVVEGTVPGNAKILVIHNSKPLASIIRDMNKYSNNFIAEQILKTLGAEVKGVPGTEEKGIEVEEEFLGKIGVEKENRSIGDGAGLSKKNKITPAQMVKLLEFMYNDFELWPEYISSLPTFGIDGSLKKRLTGFFTERRTRAKTGTLNGVTCLSGYLATADNEPVAFSFLVNRCSDVWAAKEVQNSIIVKLNKFSRNGISEGETKK